MNATLFSAKPRLFAISVLLAALIAPSVFAATEPFIGTDDRWKLFRSAHFELYSHSGDREARHVLHRLELLRAFFLQTIPLRERRPGDVTVYLFPNNREFQAYTPDGRDPNLMGFFTGGADRDVIALSTMSGIDVTLEMIQSQYIRHLFGISGRATPEWLQWGAAFLFSTVEDDRDKVAFGRPDNYRLNQVGERRPFSSEWVFGAGRYARNEKERDAFQAHSWLVLHYLFRGQSAIPSDKIADFVRFVAEGGAEFIPLAKFEEELQARLGLDFKQLDVAVEKYRKRRNFMATRVPAPAVPPKDSYTGTPITRDIIRHRLAELALRNRRSGEARLALLHAADAPDAEPRILEALGQDAAAEGDVDVARERWLRAVELGSGNPGIFHQLGMIESSRWFRSFDIYFRLPPEVATRLRMLFSRSIKRTPTQSDAYEWLAWVEATASEPSIANVNLVQSKFETLENQTHTMLALALVRLRMGDHETMHALLQQLEQSDQSAFVQQAIQQIRSYLKRNPPAPQKA